MEKKDRIVISVGLIGMFLTVLIGFSYAFWKLTKVQVTDNLILSSCLELTYEDGDAITIDDAEPLSDEEGANLAPYTFSVKNTCDITEYYEISMEVLTSSTLESKYIKANIDGQTKRLIKYAKGELKASGKENRILAVGSVEPNETKNHSLKLYLDGTQAIDTDSMNKTFRSKVVVDTSLEEIVLDTSQSFEDDTWQEITEYLQNGQFPYKIGDTKTITLASHANSCISITGSYQNTVCQSGIEPERQVKLRIANTSACTDDLISKTACGIVLEFATVPETHNLYNSGYPTGGWGISEMRTYINDTIYNLLPVELQNLIIETTVVSGGLETETTFTTTDKLYLLSTHEVWSADKDYIATSDKAYNTTRQLDYYANLNVDLNDNSSGAIKYSATGSATSWWLRTSVGNSKTSSYYVNPFGKYYSNNTGYTIGVAPAFRIG